MHGDSEREQWQNFNERLGQWISSQGFWFQLRYSLSRGGSRGAFAFHFLKLVSRFTIFVVGIALLWIVIVKTTGKQGFVDNLSESLKARMGADDIQIKGLEKEHGTFYISKLAMVGDEETFFTGLEISNLSCRRGFFDDFKTHWEPGVLEISKLEVSIHAGADSKEASKAIAEVIMQDSDQVNLNSIRVMDTTVKWGYTSRTRGSIIGSKMRARRFGGGWKVIFNGGTFTQNWLKELNIVELVAVIDPEGITFEKAVFEKDGGSVTGEDLAIEGGMQPLISGRIKFQNVDITEMLPVNARDFVEGRIAGELEVFGSTNSSKGIGFTGIISLEGDNRLTLRDKLPLLRALSVVDTQNDYRRVDFEDGSFNMRAHAGRVEIDELHFVAGELMDLKGSLVVRQPEADELLKIRGKTKFSEPDSEMDEFKYEMELSLRAAGEASESGVGFKSDKDKTLLSRLQVSQQRRQTAVDAAEELTRSYRYEGNFLATLRKNAFVRSPLLMEFYPVSEELDRIEIEVPVEGFLLELTKDQADEIYRKGSR